MDIQLKQNEIETAVRNFVSDKIGIDLTGKRLGVQFSMGRGPNALVANLSITDQTALEVPGYTDRAADAPTTDSTGPATAEVHTLPVAEAKTDEPAKTVPVEEVAVDTAAAESAPATTGLFGQS